MRKKTADLTNTVRSLSKKRHFALTVTRARGDLRRRALAVHRRGTVLSIAWSPSVAVLAATSMSARSGGQVLKQERVPERRHSGTAWMVLTKLRVNLGLTIATMSHVSMSK